MVTAVTQPPNIRLAFLWPTALALIAVSLLSCFVFGSQTNNPFLVKLRNEIPSEIPGIVPHELWNVVYHDADFINEAGKIPPFWECKNNSCYSTETWGPCYDPKQVINWAEHLSSETTRTSYNTRPLAKKTNDDLSNLCKPGFLIIGAGKCGTSSLYHYITDHPRVLPASKKQIHYFKYFLGYPMRWYLQHFPTAVSFLSQGALMSGEASPGYLPYPDVAYEVRRRLPGPRIVTIGREPIDRAYSSYRYNYVTPTIEAMRKGKWNHIDRHQNDTYYEQFLFSFQDMIRAELQILKACFDDKKGQGVLGAKDRWGSTQWAKAEYDRRESQGLPPLIDLDGFCYGNQVNRTVLRPQWAELVAKFPEKVIVNSNLHLIQSILGRGLYALPLEWWYLHFPRESLYFICTEELRDMTGQSLSRLAEFLGLPAYNFSDVVSKGAYNVGGHRGYDNEISWDKIEDETKETSATKIPLTTDFEAELRDFIRPYNERLFALVGRRCDW